MLGPVVQQLKDLGLHDYDYWVHNMEVVLEDMKYKHAKMVYSNGVSRVFDARRE